MGLPEVSEQVSRGHGIQTLTYSETHPCVQLTDSYHLVTINAINIYSLMARFKWERTVFSTNGVGKTGYVHAKEQN